QRAAEHQRYAIYGGQRVSRRTVVADTEAFNAYYDYIYRAVRNVPAAALPRVRTSTFRRNPEGLLLSAMNRPEALRWLGNATFDGKPQEVVALADADGAQITLFFDAATHELRKTETLGEDGVFGDVANETVFDDYRTIRDVKLPYHYIDKRGGIVLDDQRVSSIVLDLPGSDTLW